MCIYCIKLNWYSTVNLYLIYSFKHSNTKLTITGQKEIHIGKSCGIYCKKLIHYYALNLSLKYSFNHSQHKNTKTAINLNFMSQSSVHKRYKPIIHSPSIPRVLIQPRQAKSRFRIRKNLSVRYLYKPLLYTFLVLYALIYP